MTGSDVTKVLDVTERFRGTTYVAVKAYDVPISNRYPDGVKYSMQYGTTEGETIFRYDNFPDHPDTHHHHKHEIDGAVKSVDFDGVRSLFERFKTEVRNHGENWP